MLVRSAMRFSCDSCGASYSVDDAKIAGKTVRIRCKRCPGTITLRGAGAPPPRPPPPPSQEPPWLARLDDVGADSLPRLRDRYEARRRLGRGPLGETYLAVHSTCVGDRPMVCKRLGPSPGSTAARERLRERLEPAAMFSGPGFALVHDLFELEGELWISRQYVEGKNVAPLALDPSGPDACRRLAQIVLRSCEALEAAHAAGILHLGVSPGNVFLCDGGEVMLTGLGLTAAVGDTARYRAVLVGRAPYAAPELFDGPRDDARSDVYALGRLLEHASDGPLRAIAARATAATPARRHPSAAALRDELEAYLHGQDRILTSGC
jgi:predicted Zn finger-like uncharacterized protein